MPLGKPRPFLPPGYPHFPVGPHPSEAPWGRDKARARAHYADKMKIHIHLPVISKESQRWKGWVQGTCFMKAFDRKILSHSNQTSSHGSGGYYLCAPGAGAQEWGGGGCGLGPPPAAGEGLTSDHPSCSWRRSQDGAICRKGIKKVLEVLVVKRSLSEHWVLPGVSPRPPSRGPAHLCAFHPAKEHHPPVVAALHSSDSILGSERQRLVLAF